MTNETPGPVHQRRAGDAAGNGSVPSDDAASSKELSPQQDSDAADASPGRGADMARAALDAARQRNAAARSSRRGRGHSGRTAADSADGSAAKRLRRRRWSGPGADAARDPQLFGDIARRWVVAADTGGEIAKARLFAGWAEIVGADIAAHAQPEDLVDQELTVRAESTAWATQLRLLAPGMVKKINHALGHGTVTRIRTKGPTAPSWRFGNRHVPGRGPRDTYG
jgi:predicted nucleic acid-binding Zn ribbon protein